jgi:hypothetical protein
MLYDVDASIKHFLQNNHTAFDFSEINTLISCERSRESIVPIKAKVEKTVGQTQVEVNYNASNSEGNWNADEEWVAADELTRT